MKDGIGLLRHGGAAHLQWSRVLTNTVMLRPLPYPDADRLVLLNETAENRGRLEMYFVWGSTFLAIRVGISEVM